MNNRTLGIVSIFAGLMALPAHADDCAAPAAAMRLVPTKSYTATMVMTLDGKPRTNHAVMAGGYLYVEVAGAWHKTISGKDILDDVNNKMKTSKMICKRTGTEAVGGQPATVYTVHSENEGNVSDNRLWISSAGLPLKTESRLEGGTVIVSTFDYAHAQVPPGVK